MMDRWIPSPNLLRLISHISLFLVTTTATLAISRKIRKMLEKRKEDSSPPDPWNTVLFFPDPYFPNMEQKYPVVEANGTRNQWQRVASSYPTDPMSPTVQFLQYFEDAKICIFLAIHLMSCYPLQEILLRKHFQEGLDIKIVTDYDTSSEHNLGIIQMKRRGLRNIRAKNFGYLMHHKFAIIDGNAVLTGSVNWTKSAFRDGYENLIVTTNQSVVEQYNKEFSKLWLESEELTTRWRN